MGPFSFSSVKTVIYEAGSAARLARVCRENNARAVVIITDPGIMKLGLLDDVLADFDRERLPVVVFQDVEADPADHIVTRAIDVARTQRADMIIGFGGGSSMDVAKLVALLAHPDSTQTLADVYGVEKARGGRLPLIQVPTTAGTGSEVTPIAIVTTGETTKSGVVSERLLPDIALLDPQLTVGLPPHVTAATGIDAMVHAIEAYTSKIRKNEMSDFFAREALRRLSANLLTAVKDGTNLEARGQMLLGAMMAGQAFANAPVAAVHALAYPLGGHFHIPHGLSNSLVLPHVLRFNVGVAAEHYGELAEIIMGQQLKRGSAPADQLIDHLETMIVDAGLPTRLRELNVPESVLPQLADDAMLQQRLLVNNPREMSRDEALAIYQAAF
ncbi:iron-containing alcohol dehydrogenase [Hydrocarboniclastica marina]|uniref:Iron-containing alcohol dehydrogenase n=1 Tax=Hydrocarboniclastica marina TaxID=2259620 RepID=A0A4V1D8N2_9ALTE|nr:iron-containing alcohol dehydrogenase [Hydrocarboniclastica marina]QCF25780.1 iron-containing alcohol dehydrogenase [Hydrocarboniclastica marina]